MTGRSCYLINSNVVKDTNFLFFSVPYGNYSYIKVLADEKDLPLYGSGGFRLIWDTKFDAGLWLIGLFLPAGESRSNGLLCSRNGRVPGLSPAV